MIKRPYKHDALEETVLVEQGDFKAVKLKLKYGSADLEFYYKGNFISQVATGLLGGTDTAETASEKWVNKARLPLSEFLLVPYSDFEVWDFDMLNKDERINELETIILNQPKEYPCPHCRNAVGNNVLHEDGKPISAQCAKCEEFFNIGLTD